VRRVVALGLVLAATAVASGCSAGVAGSPSYVTDVSATINGGVFTSEAGPVSYWVEYGTSQSYDHQSAHRTHIAAANTSFVVSVPIAGLAPSTTYHYRVCAEQCSDDATFKTDSPGGRSGLAAAFGNGPGSDANKLDVVALSANGSGITNLTNAPTSADFSPAWSPDGRQIAYVFGRNNQQGTVLPIYAMNADGTNKHALTGTSFHGNPAWSPDGKQIAYTGAGSGFTHIFVMDADGNHQHDISNGGEALDPTWSPDGTRLAYAQASGATGLRDIWVMNADGSGKTPLTTTSLLDEEGAAWSPDGTKIAFTSHGDTHSLTRLSVMNADGSNPVELTPATAHDQLDPTWSPDGSTIAFEENGDLYTVPAAGGTPVRLTTAADLLQLAWSPRP
jgi:Tol biopolymer transport system component